MTGQGTNTEAQVMRTIGGIPPGWNKGGIDEEVKLLEIVLARCQKSRGVLHLKIFLNCLSMKEFSTSWKTNLA